MEDWGQIEVTVELVEKVLSMMKVRQLNKEDIENVQFAIEEINNILYHSNKINIQNQYNIESPNEYQKFVREVEEVVDIWKQTITRRKAGKDVDIEFWKIYEYFKYVNKKEIYETVVRHFLALPENARLKYRTLSRRYTFLEGRIDYTLGDFSLIEQYVEMMSDKIEDYKWLYEKLADNRSKKILNGIISYWFDFNIEKLHTYTETIYHDYYDLDILKCTGEEVLVDLGAYNGDSIIDFIKTYGTYKKIYAYEITPSTYNLLVQNLSEYPEIVPILKGVSSTTGVMYVDDIGNGAGNKLSDQGETAVEVVTLDDDIKQSISIIKMDIEGAEKNAIIGATNHIKLDKPKMLISSYHIPADIFDIPVLINSIRDDYTYYMRFNGCGLWPCDYVLFAV